MVTTLALLLFGACQSLTPASTPTTATLAPSATSAADDIAPSSTPTPVASPNAMGAQVPFEPRIPLPVRPTPSETPAEPEAAPDAMPAPSPTPVPLPRECLQGAFSAEFERLGDCSGYTIDLDVDPVASRVTGSQEILYINRETVPMEDIILRLLPNAPNYGGTMTVTDITVDGKPISPDVLLAETALQVPLVPALEPGAATTLRMKWTVDVPRTRSYGYGLFSNVEGVIALPNVYPLIPVYNDEGWHAEVAPPYADDVFSDVAAYTVRVTAPAGMVLVASGTCAQPAAGSWLCEATAMRDFYLVLSKNFERVSTTITERLPIGFAEPGDGEVTINSYYYRGENRMGQLGLDIAVDAVRAYTERFGPYPYTELDVVETPSLLGGMEYPGLVVVKDAYYRGAGAFEWIVAHELAHQWWYVVVGSNQIDQPWMDETLTSYSTMLYYEIVYGEARARSILHSEFEATYRRLEAAGHDRPVGLTARALGPTLYWDVIYRKGPLYYQELRDTVGDAQFFAILRSYYDDRRFRIATPEDLLRAIQRITGDRHMDIYNRWITGTD